MKEQPLTVEEAAKVLSLAPETIGRWISEGRVRSVTDPGRGVLIPAGELEHIAGPAAEYGSMESAANKLENLSGQGVSNETTRMAERGLDAQLKEIEASLL